MKTFTLFDLVGRSITCIIVIFLVIHAIRTLMNTKVINNPLLASGNSPLILISVPTL